MRAKLPDKLYYGIGEVAEAFSVNTSLIRFWEKEFEELQPKKNAKGDRKFSKNDITSLELIYHLLKEKGYTIAGAKAYLKTNKKQTLEKMEIISKLEFVKSELIQIKNEL